MYLFNEQGDLRGENAERRFLWTRRIFFRPLTETLNEITIPLIFPL